MPTAVVEEAAERMPLRRFRDGDGRLLFDVPRAPLPDTSTPAPVRFLSTWEALLLVHARRTEVLPEAYRPLVFSNRNPHSVPTFLVDGAVAGTWRYERGRVSVEPFEPLAGPIRDAVDAEARALARFHD